MSENIKTKQHDAIVWRVHDFIVANQGQYYHTEELCSMFWGEFNPSLDRAMRLIIEEIVNDRGIQKLIIGTPNGYIHPRPDQYELILTYIDAQESAAKKLFFRTGSIKYRLDHDMNYKAPIGKRDSVTYEAFLREVVAEVEKELSEQPMKRYKEEVKPKYQETPSGQYSLALE